MMRFFKIIIFTIILFSGNEILNKDQANAACALTGGVLSVVEIDGGGCETAPDEYEITIYSLYLCTSAPTAPTTTDVADLDAGGCVLTFENSSGSTVSVSEGGSAELDGTFTRPPNDTYTHGYAKMNNTFGITAQLELDGNKDGHTGGTGRFCSTVSGTGTHQQSSTHSSSSVCGATPTTAGKFVETLNHFGGVGDPFTSADTANNVNGTSASITGILVDTNEHQATTEGEVVRLHGLITFADSVTFTESTSQVDLSFNVGEGMSFNDAGGNLQMGSGPFQAIIRVE